MRFYAGRASLPKSRGGFLENLPESTRQLANRVDPAIEQPNWGQLRVSNELKERSQSISGFGARGGWQRHDLENIKKRLKALEAKMAQEGRALTEAQVTGAGEGQGREGNQPLARKPAGVFDRVARVLHKLPDPPIHCGDPP